jgi:membrane protein YdbS with pleckstrin-like domain
MGKDDGLLADDEELVVDTHPHWKALIVPAIVLPVVVGLACWGFFAMTDFSGRKYAQIAVAVIALAVIVWACVFPWLRWRTTRFIVTSRRVVIRTGVITRTGRDIPLTRVNDVTYTHGPIDRLLGCGTLLIESGGERGQLVVNELPHVAAIQRRLSDLVEDANASRPGAAERTEP